MNNYEYIISSLPAITLDIVRKLLGSVLSGPLCGPCKSFLSEREYP